MALGTLEILATILIVISVVKMVSILINPDKWMGFAGKIYSKPGAMSFVSLVLALVVLYFLVDAGVTITQILAIMLFTTLLMAVGLASYLKPIIKKVDINKVLSEQWYYVLLWLALIAWGAYEVFLL